MQVQRRAVQADYLEYSVDFGDGLRGEVGLMSYVAGVIAEQLDSLEQGGMGALRAQNSHHRETFEPTAMWEKGMIITRHFHNPFMKKSFEVTSDEENLGTLRARIVGEVEGADEDWVDESMYLHQPRLDCRLEGLHPTIELKEVRSASKQNRAVWRELLARFIHYVRAVSR